MLQAYKIRVMLSHIRLRFDEDFECDKDDLKVFSM